MNKYLSKNRANMQIKMSEIEVNIKYLKFFGDVEVFNKPHFEHTNLKNADNCILDCTQKLKVFDEFKQTQELFDVEKSQQATHFNAQSFLAPKPARTFMVLGAFKVHKTLTSPEQTSVFKPGHTRGLFDESSKKSLLFSVLGSGL